MKKLKLIILPQKLAICQIKKNSEIPSWATKNEFFQLAAPTTNCQLFATKKICRQKFARKKIGARSKSSARSILRQPEF